MRRFVALVLIPLTGCVTTTRCAVDKIPVAGLSTEAGELTVIEENGDQATYSGPVTVLNRGAQLRVERELLPSATFTTRQVSHLELATPSPGRTALLTLGIATVVGAIAVLAAVTAQSSTPHFPPIHFEGPLY
jgi:hypothetical protein